MLRIKPNIPLLIAVVLISVTTVFGQPQDVFKAYDLYKEGRFEDARKLIDQAVADKQGESNSLAWHIRGFIYKDIYSQVDHANPKSAAREEALKSFFNSMAFDKEKANQQNNERAIRFLATSYYNDAVLIMRELDMHNVNTALDSYILYKENMLKLDPADDFREKDVEFYKALATCNRKIYEVDRENRREYLDKALSYYDIVLQIDPENYGAYYNTAVNLYNEGAWRIEQMDPDADIPQVVRIQAVSIKNFENALPYMIKAYELNPEREETLKGLRGIFLSLNEEEKANIYKKELEEKKQRDK